MFLVGDQSEYLIKLKPLYTAFAHSIKRSEYRKGIKFDKDPLALEQNNCLTKIVNVYIVCDLDSCPRYPTNNFKFITWSNLYRNKYRIRNVCIQWIWNNI